jgi:hypothetical protein
VRLIQRLRLRLHPHFELRVPLETAAAPRTERDRSERIAGLAVADGLHSEALRAVQNLPTGNHDVKSADLRPIGQVSDPSKTPVSDGHPGAINSPVSDPVLRRRSWEVSR